LDFQFFIFGYFTIVQVNNSSKVSHDLFIVSRKYERSGQFFIQSYQNFHNMMRVFRVQVGRGLIGQYQRGLMYNRSGNGCALAFTLR
jgi:hypothetical protein